MYVRDILCVPILRSLVFFVFFFFNDTATTEIYTLSLHDALPILQVPMPAGLTTVEGRNTLDLQVGDIPAGTTREVRSEEHTSELQSRRDLVCRLLLEKKKKKKRKNKKKRRNRKNLKSTNIMYKSR